MFSKISLEPIYMFSFVISSVAQANFEVFFIFENGDNSYSISRKKLNELIL